MGGNIVQSQWRLVPVETVEGAAGGWHRPDGSGWRVMGKWLSPAVVAPKGEGAAARAGLLAVLAQRRGTTVTYGVEHVVDVSRSLTYEQWAELWMHRAERTTRLAREVQGGPDWVWEDPDWEWEMGYVYATEVDE